MEFAINRFNELVKFTLECISKALLQLSPHQMNALQSILSGKDIFVCLPTGQGISILFECFHTAMTFYTVVNLSKASRTVPYCCSAIRHRSFWQR